jgi:hypothetical protein
VASSFCNSGYIKIAPGKLRPAGYLLNCGPLECRAASRPGDLLILLS